MLGPAHGRPQTGVPCRSGILAPTPTLAECADGRTEPRGDPGNHPKNAIPMIIKQLSGAG